MYIYCDVWIQRTKVFVINYSDTNHALLLFSYFVLESVDVACEVCTYFN